MASLAALKTVIQKTRSSSQIRVITFGQPRIGNIDLAYKHNELLPDTFRVVHSDDIVPHLPACAKNKTAPGIDEDDDSKPCSTDKKKENFHHGIEIWYPINMTENSTYYECLGEPYGEDFECSNMLSFEWSKVTRYIHAHRYYFDQRVPRYGKAGCVRNATFDEISVRMIDESKNSTSGTFVEKIKRKVKRAWQSFVDKIKTFKKD